MALIKLRGIEPQLIKTTVNKCIFKHKKKIKNNMKTAMQEFIEDELRGETKPMAYYLDLEKEQIINAFGNGEYITFCKDRLDYDPEDYKFSNSEEYYAATFTQSSE